MKSVYVRPIKNIPYVVSIESISAKSNEYDQNLFVSAIHSAYRMH